MLKITGYADKVSVFPGQPITFMVNCEEASYDAEVVRVVCGDANPRGPGVKLYPVSADVDGTYPGRPQAIHAGSFGVVTATAPFAGLTSFSVKALVAPTTPDKGRQGIVTRWDPETGHGFALYIDEDGGLAAEVGDGAGGVARAAARTRFRRGAWYVVGMSFDGATGALTLVQKPLQRFPGQNDAASLTTPSELRAFGDVAAPLIFAARYSHKTGSRIFPTEFMNGKLEAPAIYGAAMSAAELAATPAGSVSREEAFRAIGIWDFSLDISGTALTDITRNGLDGYVVNTPTRGVVGSRHTVDHHDWKAAPEMWAAIHFHDDDIYDAGWDADFTWTVPSGIGSGVYAVRLTCAGQTQFVSFIVRAAPAERKSKVLYLFSLATYIAYANEHFGTNSALVELHLNRATVLHPHQVFLNEHREYGHSLYDLHSDGSGVYYSSRLRPILNMQPLAEANHGARPSNLWLFNADTHITDWLEHCGVDYDVATDEDLHKEGIDLLREYSVIVTATHPEYYSSEMWDALYRYTQGTGRLMYLGGNGFYWRVAFHDTLPGLMEVRRAEGGNRAWEPPTGEYYHSFNGEYGGMWRRQGNRAPNVMCGVAYVAQGFDASSYYVRNPDSHDPRAAWIFDGVGSDEKIGDFGLIGDGAAGMEIDAMNYGLGTPPNALVLATSENHTEAHVLALDEMLFNFMGSSGDVCPQVHADMVFYETIGGGAVFSVGSIAWCGALSHNGYDNNVATLTGNVLRRFCDAEPFVHPDDAR